MGGAGGGERGELRAVGLVVIREVGVEVGRGKLRAERCGLSVGRNRENPAGFEGGERAGEDPELVDEAAFEAAVAETFAEGDGVAATAGDVFCEVIADDLGAGGLAVDEEAEAGGAAGAIVGDSDVDPFIDRERIGGADRNRVAGPEVNERPFRAAVFDEELVAPAAGVGPRARAVQDDGALFGIGSLNPEGNCERFVALKITELGLDGVVTGKANGGTSAGTAGDGFVFLGSRSVVVGLQSVREAPGAG